jgi:hypothetical protein
VGPGGSSWVYGVYREETNDVDSGEANRRMWGRGPRPSSPVDVEVKEMQGERSRDLVLRCLYMALSTSNA